MSFSIGKSGPQFTNGMHVTFPRVLVPLERQPTSTEGVRLTKPESMAL